MDCCEFSEFKVSEVGFLSGSEDSQQLLGWSENQNIYPSNGFLSLDMGPWIIQLTSDISSNPWNENNCFISRILPLNYKVMMVSKNKVMEEYTRHI